MLVIRFDIDWGHEWPLWNESDIDDLTTKPATLGLSEELTRRLRAWYDFWDAHLDPDPIGEPGMPRWDSEENETVWLLGAPTLADALRRELAGRAEVKVPEWVDLQR